MKFISIFSTGLLFIPLVYAASTTDIAKTFDPVYNEYQVVYSPSTNLFSTGSMVDDRIVLTKKSSVGSGGYSEYYDKNGTPVLELGSNFEFIKDGQLIASHNADLTFFRVIYQDGKFSETQLTEKEIQSLFPDVKIIKISQFSGKRIKIDVTPSWEDTTLLLLNDQGKDFYKYAFDPADVKISDIAGLIRIPGTDTPQIRKITFSHYGNDSKSYPKYTIEIGNQTLRPIPGNRQRH